MCVSDININENVKQADHTFAELDKYPEKYDELDKKYSNFRRETYQANLMHVE